MFKIRRKGRKISNSERRIATKYLKSIESLESAFKWARTLPCVDDDYDIFIEFIRAEFYSLRTKKERQIFNKLISWCSFHYDGYDKTIDVIIPYNINEVYFDNLTSKSYREYPSDKVTLMIYHLTNESSVEHNTHDKPGDRLTTIDKTSVHSTTGPTMLDILEDL